jgi:hypothetical protein
MIGLLAAAFVSGMVFMFVMTLIFQAAECHD